MRERASIAELFRPAMLFHACRLCTGPAAFGTWRCSRCTGLSAARSRAGRLAEDASSTRKDSDRLNFQTRDRRHARAADHPARPARHFPQEHQQGRLARAVPAARSRLRRLSGRRRGARPAAGRASEGFRRRHRRHAGRGQEAVPQLPPDRPALPAGPCGVRPRDHRSRHLPRHRRGRRRRRPPHRRWPHRARQHLGHHRGRCGPPRLPRQCAVLRHQRFLGARLRRRHAGSAKTACCA